MSKKYNNLLKTPRTLEWLEKNFDEFDDEDLDNIVTKQQLTETFIERHSEDLDWELISQYQTLSEDFIAKHKIDVYWCKICMYQKLSEKFIEEYSDYVDWSEVSYRQKLSEKFIHQHQEKINFSLLIINEKMHPKFINVVRALMKYHKNFTSSDWRNFSLLFAAFLSLVPAVLEILRPMRRYIEQ